MAVAVSPFGDIQWVAVVLVVRVGHQGVGDEVQEGVPQQPPGGEAEQQSEQSAVLGGVGLQWHQEEEQVWRCADHQRGRHRLKP